MMSSTTSPAPSRVSYLPVARNELTDEKGASYAPEAPSKVTSSSWYNYRGPGVNVARLLILVAAIVLLFHLAVPKDAKPQAQRPALHPIYIDSEVPEQYLQHGGRLARREDTATPAEPDTSLVFA